MIAAWMTGALLIGALLAFAARVLDEVFRLYVLPRRFVWAGALLLAVVLPVWLAVSPPPSQAPPRPGGAGPAAGALAAADAGVPVAPHTRGARLLIGELFTALDRAPASLVARADDRLGTGTLDRLLVSTWGLLSAAGLLLLGSTMWRMARARRRWQPRMLGSTRVYVAARGGPAVVGLFRPAIVVPAWLLRASDPRQRLVVLHEREHVRGGDPALLTCALAALVALPWNLPLHGLVRRLRLAVELDCDRRVLRQGADPRVYGALLIDMAARAQRLPLAAAALADRASELEHRIVAMTGAPPRHRHTRALLAGTCAALLLLLATRVDPRADAPALAAAGAAPAAPELAHGAPAADTQPLPPPAAPADPRASSTSQRAPAAPADPQASSAPQRAPFAAADGPQPKTPSAALAHLPAPAAPLPAAGAFRLAAAAPAERRPPRTLRVRPVGADTAEPAPLWLLDGVVVSEADVQARVEVDRIARIEVMKGPAAAAIYGPEAAGGVIRIATRR